MNLPDYFARQPLQIDGGIYKYTESDFYWGITSRQEIENFLNKAAQDGFKTTYSTFKFTSRFDYANNYSRADFHFLLPCKPNSHILDLGSGFGNVTIPLSKYHAHVVAVDASMPLLRFSKMRAESEGSKNITYIQVDPLEKCNLPFKKKSFDVIILNGVLEWIGPSDTTKDPRDIQINFLRHIKEFLKDDGVIYIGIENRLFPGWLSRDPHSKLPWTVILPRRIADWYAKKKGQAGYRTYIYSKYGYKKLLRAAGLMHQQFLFPFRSYREPDIIYPSAREVRFFVQSNVLQKYLTRKWALFTFFMRYIGLDTTFISSFMMCASPSLPSSHNLIYHILVSTHHQYASVTHFVKISTPTDEHVTFMGFIENMSHPAVLFQLRRIPDGGLHIEILDKNVFA